MTLLDVCQARLSECRTEAAVEKVLDETWAKIMKEHGHSMEAANQNTQVLYLGRERREGMRKR